MRTIVLGIVVGIGVTTISFICTSVYLHRGVAHRAVAFSRPVDAIFKTLIWLTTGIKVREWVAVHRKHHAHTDTIDDPHSPAVSGWTEVQMKNVLMYRRAARDQANIDKYARDLAPTKWDRYLFDRAWLGLGLGTAILCLVFGWQVGLIAAGFHVVYYLMGSGAVNAIGHHFGRRPYDNSATNLQWLALLTAGEGFHNNHHAAPTSARFAHRWYQIDLGWLVIKPLTWLGLAKVRLRELKLTAAAER